MEFDPDFAMDAVMDGIAIIDGDKQYSYMNQAFAQLLGNYGEFVGAIAVVVTLGYLATSGNTENSTLNTAFEVGFKTGKWAHLYKAAAINAMENKVTTAEAYDTSWKSERNLTDKDFLFGRLHWRKDRFGGFDTQFSQTVGYGRRLIDTDKHKLNGELGVGARQSEDQSGFKDDETVYRGGLDYKWKLSETAEFRQDLTAESGEANTYVESVTALSAKLLGDLALVASYTIKHNTDGVRVLAPKLKIRPG